MCGICTDFKVDIWIMIRELLKVIKEAEDMVDNQSQLLAEFDDKLKKVYQDLKEISEQIDQANSKEKSTNKD